MMQHTKLSKDDQRRFQAAIDALNKQRSSKPYHPKSTKGKLLKQARNLNRQHQKALNKPKRK